MEKNNKITLDIDHFDKIRVEYFLNSVGYALAPIPFDAQDLADATDILGGFKFKVKDQAIFVTVIFASSYFHANDIGKANSQKRSNMRWTVNGDILFMVESLDENASNEMLGHFAGKE